MNSDPLLIILIPLTAVYVWISRKGRVSAVIARSYMLGVFFMAALASLGILHLDPNVRVFLLRAGWMSLVLEEVAAYCKARYWSRKASKANG